MARAQWNITVDIYTGPSTPMPFTYLSTRQARVVPASRTVARTPLALFPSVYITHSGARLSAGTTVAGAGALTWNWGLANVVEIPSGSGNFMTVAQAAVVQPRLLSLPPYAKAWLVP